MTASLIKLSGAPSQGTTSTSSLKHEMASHHPLSSDPRSLTVLGGNYEFLPPASYASRYKSSTAPSDNRKSGETDAQLRAHRDQYHHQIHNDDTSSLQGWNRKENDIALIEPRQRASPVEPWQHGSQNRSSAKYHTVAPVLESSIITSNHNGGMVDHTYRDFSGVPPSSEDFERYKNKKKEYHRRIKEKREKPPPKNSSSSHSKDD
eukprot:CAMPEP_0197235498 /NCGR_PEP_ID=MMETSP1429-20130617/2907_1 /TAXON_ID=49237 /ORGANISM="Chaetoceros  sp., Strain UNC1202" /LENGTH=205 /DNA_ID=CAMNT_0042694095 /DNA_START=303 /DNA_END=917 /DNA_ORIENTATION=+